MWRLPLGLGGDLGHACQCAGNGKCQRDDTLSGERKTPFVPLLDALCALVHKGEEAPVVQFIVYIVGQHDTAGSVVERCHKVFKEVVSPRKNYGQVTELATQAFPVSVPGPVA
eukprot:10479632-Ditylum_brightwellii.AAC.1